MCIKVGAVLHFSGWKDSVLKTHNYFQSCDWAFLPLLFFLKQINLTKLFGIVFFKENSIFCLISNTLFSMLNCLLNAMLGSYVVWLKHSMNSNGHLIWIGMFGAKDAIILLYKKKTKTQEEFMYFILGFVFFYVNAWVLVCVRFFCQYFFSLQYVMKWLHVSLINKWSWIYGIDQQEMLSWPMLWSARN